MKRSLVPHLTGETKLRRPPAATRVMANRRRGDGRADWQPQARAWVLPWPRRIGNGENRTGETTKCAS